LRAIGINLGRLSAAAPVDIQAMGPGDDERVMAAGHLFDDQPQKDA